MLQITLFGGFRLALDHAPLPPIPSHTARSLFAFLVCHADQDHTRSRLIGHFYPDLPEATARRRLSQALWQIRNTLQQQGLEKSVFLTDGDTVRWHDDLPYALDVADFTAQLGAADQVDGAVRPLITSLTAAANLYTGDLLDGLYDEWILPLRERLRTRYAALLTELIQLHKSQGDYERSLHYARQSLRINPLSEAGHREVMRLCHLLGRTNEALRQYDTLRELLDEEFAAEPAAETRTLYRQITGQSTGQISGPSISETTDQPTPRAPLSAGQSTPHRLVGRGAERQQLIALVEQALGGSGTVALIEGEPGIGKSRLLAELTDDATWRGLRVLATQGREVALQTPFAAVRDLLHQELTPLRIAQLVEMLDNVWLAEIVAFLPALAAHVPLLPARARLDEDPDQTRLTEALRCVFQALGQLTPYLLIIDDLQWVDTDSLQMVQRLLPTLQQAPCCLCLAFRSDEARARGVVWELVRTLDLAVHSQRLLLTRLQIAEIEEILRHAFGAMPDAAALADELTRQSGGNPLFIHETLRALADHGLLQQAAGGQWAIDLEKLRRQAAVQPTPQLRQVVAARLTHLDDDCCALLNTVATLGAEFDLATLRAISPLPNLQAMTALERLTQRNFITPRSGRYGMSHDQIRQIVYAQIDAATKQQLHGQIGEGLAAGQRADAATLAYHFAHGHRWAAAVTHYTAAGQAATAVAAYTAAVEFYTAALAAAEETTYAAADRFDLLAAREAALATLGNREAQWADIETMAELATTPQQQSLVQRRRFWAQLDTAALDEAEASAQNALSLAKASGDQAAIGASLVAVGTALDRRSHSAAAVPYLQEAVALYQQLGDPNSEAQARVELANALTATADYNAALPELERAHGLYQQTDDRAGAARALSRLGALQMERGAREEAAACFAQALAIAQAIGYQRVEVTTLVNWANLHYAQNQIGDFLACNERALALLGAARAHGQAFIRVNMASVRHSLLGDHVTAQRDAEAALAQFCELGDRGGEAQCLEVLCNIAMVDGKYQEAQSHVERAHAAVNAAGDRWMAVFVHAAQATLARHQRQPAVGLAAIAAAETLCNQFGMADLLVPLQSIQATLLLQTGERAQAATLARQTFAMLNPSVQQGHKVAYECYQTLMACGCPAEATAALTYAHAELERALAGLTPEQRRTSLRHVPEHAAIVQQWQATHAATQQVHLVRADVPTGRPVADDEWVAVSLTVSHPDDQAVQGKKARRQQQLARILQEAAAQNAAPTVEDLSGLLDAGKATIKRDLAELRAAGFEVKTRGSREG